MSQREFTTVTCPQCGHSQEFLVWPSLNVSLDPDEKPRLLSGALHRFTCEQCAAQTEVSFPLLYHDMDRKLMIHYLQEGETPEEHTEGIMGSLLGMMGESYTFRYVHSRNEMIEKILIFDAGLDDRVVELFKFLLRAKNSLPPKDELYFSRLSVTSAEDGVIAFNLLGGDGVKEVTVSLATYRTCEKRFEMVVAADVESVAHWKRVDLAYVADLMVRQSRSTQP